MPVTNQNATAAVFFPLHTVWTEQPLFLKEGAGGVSLNTVVLISATACQHGGLLGDKGGMLCVRAAWQEAEQAI